MFPKNVKKKLSPSVTACCYLLALFSDLLSPSDSKVVAAACPGLYSGSSAAPGERNTLFSKGSIKSHWEEFHWPGFSHMTIPEPINVTKAMALFWLARPGAHAQPWSWGWEQPQSNHMDWELEESKSPHENQDAIFKKGKMITGETKATVSHSSCQCTPIFPISSVVKSNSLSVSQGNCKGSIMPHDFIANRLQSDTDKEARSHEFQRSDGGELLKPNEGHLAKVSPVITQKEKSAGMVLK